MTGNNEYDIKYFKEHGGELEYVYYTYFYMKLEYEEFLEIWYKA